MSNNFDDNDLFNKSDEDLKNEAFKILEEDVFKEAEKFSEIKGKNTSNKVNKNSSDNRTYSFTTSENETVSYNNYENYTTYPSEEKIKAEIENKKGIKVIFVFIAAIIILFILIFSVVINVSINDYDDDYGYEELYDIEYDSDNDGYLSYEEKEIYREDRASDYSEFINIEEVYNDKENKRLFLKIQNRNSYLIDNVYLNIAFYDKDNNLVFVEKEYINNISLDKAAMIAVYYDKEFDHYETICTAEIYSSNIQDKDADIEVISSNIDYRRKEISYVIKNNENVSVTGCIYLILYDNDGNIIGIEEDYVFGIGANKEYKGNFYVGFFRENDINTVVVDTSDIVKELY